jgi:hypothetical protein
MDAFSRLLVPVDGETPPYYGPARRGAIREGHMPKLIAIALGIAVLSTLPALAANQSTPEMLIFGKDPGKDRAFACFVRHYDAAHLKAHPKQNVTDMLVLVDSTYTPDDQSRTYALTLGTNFRTVKQQYQSYGGCNGTIEGQKLGCYIDCDGGAIDVRFKDTNNILVDIPYGARLEDPTADFETDDPTANIPDKAQFGPDDKTFLLTRVANDLCVGLINDDDKQALLDSAK